MTEKNQAAKMMQLEPGDIALVGFPDDRNSSHAKGASEGPDRIRRAFHNPSSNKSCESAIDLGSEARLKIMTDPPIDSFFKDISAAVSQVLDKKARLLALGGDHAITYPIFHAYRSFYPQLQILHIDAHPDLYDNFDNNPFSHASPFARIMENKLADSLIQVGIRTLNPHQKEQSDRFGTRILKPGEQGQIAELLVDNTPLYISIDMDGLDPAFAPGVSHPEPGGLSTRELIEILQVVDVPVVGGDIVELNPSRDPTGITAMVGAKIMKELCALMLKSR